MKPLILTLRTRLHTSLDLRSLTPDNLRDKSVRAIREIQLPYGRDLVAVGDLFSVMAGNTSDIQIRRCSGKVKHIGYEMSTGQIEVRGDSGDYTGHGMRGGTIRVNGNSGHLLGSNMRNGRINVSGNTGDLVGSAFPGKEHGMSGGLITIWGNSGKRTGEHMRRGTILVMGDAGAYLGARMIAGTLIVLGQTVYPVGFGMNRGTIILRRPLPIVQTTFRTCGLLKMEFLRLFFREIAAIGKRFAFFEGFGPEVIRYSGDHAALGKGEILVLQNAK